MAEARPVSASGRSLHAYPGHAALAAALLGVGRERGAGIRGGDQEVDLVERRCHGLVQLNS